MDDVKSAALGQVSDMVSAPTGFTGISPFERHNLFRIKSCSLLPHAQCRARAAHSSPATSLPYTSQSGRRPGEQLQLRCVAETAIRSSAANSAGLALSSPRGSVIACGGCVPWAGAAAAAVR